MDERNNPKAQENEKKRRERHRKYYAEHRAEIRATLNEARRLHPPVYNAATRKLWYEKNKERLLAKKREWEAANPDKKKYYNSQSYKRDREGRIQYERDKRVERNPEILEKRERADFFRGRPWLRNLFGRWQSILSWAKFKGLYEQILNGPCDICGKAGEKMRIDHCHEKMVFRGLLCHNCNVALGSFHDDPAMLRRAAEYLEKV